MNSPANENATFSSTNHSANDFSVEDPTKPGNETMAEIVETTSSSERPTVRMRALKPTPSTEGW